MIRAYLREGSERRRRSASLLVEGEEKGLDPHFLEANLESSSDLAPVTTIFPEAKMRAVVFGSRIRMMTAANRWREKKEGRIRRKSARRFLGAGKET